MGRTKGSKNKLQVSIEDRFWNKVEKTDSCWIWTAYKNRLGYGMIGNGKKVIQAHRLSYVIHKGDIPEGMCVCHKCDNPSCVRPYHLWLGSQKENMRDRSLKGRCANTSGERNGNAKLNRQLVKEIRELYGTGDFSHTGLAEIFNVSKANIYYILNNKSWT